MNESTLWDYVKKGMSGRWLATRIETVTSLGVPDVTYSVKGVHGWIELKWVPKAPVKQSTKMRLSHLTEQQKQWIFSRGKLAGDVWLLVRVEDEFFLFDHKFIHDIQQMTIDEWRVNCEVNWSKKINFEELSTILSS